MKRRLWKYIGGLAVVTAITLGAVNFVYGEEEVVENISIPDVDVDKTFNLTLCKEDLQGSPLEGWTMQVHDNLISSIFDEADSQTEEDGCVTFELDASAPNNNLWEAIEVSQDGWVFDSASCDVEDSLVEMLNQLNGRVGIVVEVDTDITCTFVNKFVGSGDDNDGDGGGNNDDETGTITIRKETMLASETLFHFNASFDEDGFDLSDNHDYSSGPLEPGTYSVSEVDHVDYELISAVCSDGSNPNAIDLSAGENVTCIFFNLFSNDSDGGGEEPVDFCTNIEGNQSIIPEGYHFESAGVCVLNEAPPDGGDDDNSDNNDDNNDDGSDNGDGTGDGGDGGPGGGGGGNNNDDDDSNDSTGGGGGNSFTRSSSGSTPDGGTGDQGEVLGAAVGLPRTGSGGEAMINILLLVVSGFTTVLGGWKLKSA